MSAGPLQQHDSRFRDRNLLLLALLGLVSRARQSRRSIAERCVEGAVGERRRRLASSSAYLILGVVSLGKTIERRVLEFAAEAPQPARGAGASAWARPWSGGNNWLR